MRGQYQLTDGELLSRLMRCPDRLGTCHTLRSLAEVAGLSKSKIGDMLHGRCLRVTEPQADAISAAVGVKRKALFYAVDVLVREREQRKIS